MIAEARGENSRLQAENDRLTRTGMLLRDSNKLKDMYLGKLLESNGELSNMFQDFAIKVDQKLKKSQYEQVQKAVSEEIKEAAYLHRRAALHIKSMKKLCVLL